MKFLRLLSLLFFSVYLQAREYASLFIKDIENYSSQCLLRNVTIREIGSITNSGWILYAEKGQWYSSLSRVLSDNVSIDFLFNASTFNLHSNRLWIDTLTKNVWSSSGFTARFDDGTLKGEEFFFSFADLQLYFPKSIEVLAGPLTIVAGEGVVDSKNETIVLSKGVKTVFTRSSGPSHTR